MAKVLNEVLVDNVVATEREGTGSALKVEAEAPGSSEWLWSGSWGPGLSVMGAVW